MVKIELLKTIEDQSFQNDLVVTIQCDEFTCLCPYSGQPDFALLSITYTPHSSLLEMVSLKNYLASYSHQKILQEIAVSQICNDLVNLLKPKSLSVKGDFSSRGGIRLLPCATFSQK